MTDHHKIPEQVVHYEQVAKLTDITYRQWYTWVTSGLITTTTGWNGQGYPHAITGAEFEIVKLAVRLVRWSKMSPTVAFTIARALDNGQPVTLPGHPVVTLILDS